MSSAQLLLTGATGYLAPYVIAHLRERYSLKLFVRTPPPAPLDGLPYVVGDLESGARLEDACAGCFAVVHMAAVVTDRLNLPLDRFADVIVKGTWHLADACVHQHVSRLVNVSSIRAAGHLEHTEYPHHTSEANLFRSHDLYYPLAKFLAEEVADAYHQAYGLSVLHLRPGVLGGDPRNPPPGSPFPFSPGKFMHVDPRDVAGAIEAALTTSVTHGRYYVVAARADAAFDWQSAVVDLGYQSQYNWPEIPLNLK